MFCNSWVTSGSGAPIFNTDSNRGWSSERRGIECSGRVRTLLKPWQENDRQEPAGGARLRAGQLGCVGTRGSAPPPAAASGSPGRAPCPFKESGRTTRTLWAGVSARTRTTRGEPKDGFFSLASAGRRASAARRELRVGGPGAEGTRAAVPCSGVARRDRGRSRLRTRRSPGRSGVERACRGPSARMSIRISASQYARSRRLR